jgi:hypothetical protein
VQRLLDCIIISLFSIAYKIEYSTKILLGLVQQTEPEVGANYQPGKLNTGPGKGT